MLRRHVVLAVAISMMAGFLFDGHVRNIANIDYSIYVTFTISAGLELPADLLSIPAVDHLGRRWSSIVSLFLSGVAMLVCALIIGKLFDCVEGGRLLLAKVPLKVSKKILKPQY